jgi:phosphohistidine phosphatase
LSVQPGHRVYLVRHAKAEDRREDDASRRLTAQGRARFERLVARLGERLAVTRVATSPLRRARETAELVARAARAPVEEEPLLESGASNGKEILALARRAPPGKALVGHNPELAEALALAAGREVEVPTGAVAALDVRSRDVSLAWLEAPGR